MRPPYLATQMLAGLHKDDRRPARVVGKLALRADALLRPFGMAVVAGFTADGGTGCGFLAFGSGVRGEGSPRQMTVSGKLSLTPFFAS
jgi:hypothetical protein